MSQRQILCTYKALRTASFRQDETMHDKHPQCLSRGLGISCQHMPNASIAVSTELLESDRTRRPRYVTCSALSVDQRPQSAKLLSSSVLHGNWNLAWKKSESE